MQARPVPGRHLLATALLACCAAASAEQHTIPLFVAASPGGDPQGVLRLANDTDAAATVTVQAIDDAGGATGPATLTLNALAAVELSATELQSGNAAKGLPTGLGALAGEVRLAIDSNLPVTPSAYVRGADGTLTAMNATVLGAVSIGQAAGSGQAAGAGQETGAGQDAGADRSATGGRDAHRYGIALFHPASHPAQPSRLRLINPSDAAAQVTIEARDDAGSPAPSGAVRLTLPANGARTLTAQELEAGDGGDAAFAGQLGAGVGNWRLSVSSDRSIEVLHVTVSAAGGWRNLSTTTVDGWAPSDAAAFEARFLDRTLLLRSGGAPRSYRVLGDGRIGGTGATAGAAAQSEPHAYRRIGRDAARISLTWVPEPDSDFGPLPLRCDVDLYFTGASEGWHSAACTNSLAPGKFALGGVWSILEPGATPLDLGPGPDDRFYTVGAAIEPLTLPAAASGGEGELGYSLTPEVPGLTFDAATRTLTGTPTAAARYAMTWRVHGMSGDTDRRRFGIVVAGAADDASTSHAVGDTLSELPDEAWRPDAISNGSYTASGDGVTIELDRGGYFESGGHRYTCQSAMGCTVNNRELAEGSILRTALDNGSAAGGGGSFDLAGGFDLQDGNDNPGGIAFADGRFFILDFFDRKVYAYTPAGQRVPDADFQLQDGNTRPYSIAFANGRFFIVDDADVKVYAYTSAGQRVPDADFELQDGNDDPWGIAFANGRVFITDLDDNKVYAYTPAGQRVPDADFDTQNRPASPRGIAFANGRFFIVDFGNYKVYAYTPAGQRVPEADFETQGSDGAPYDIASANGRFFIVDNNANKVYAYYASGQYIDDHGYDPASATPAAIGSDTPGELYAGDSDWFRVEVDAPGKLAVYTAGNVDTVGQLEDASGALVRADNDSGAGANFSISAPVAAGTYFVRVEAYNANTAGAYTLHVRFTEEDSGTTAPPDGGDDDGSGTGGGTVGDHGDDAASATTVAAASSDTPGALTREDSDWFRIAGGPRAPRGRGPRRGRLT